jgi:prephenate dehydrogenase
MRHVAICGIGLIGGSLALALRGRGVRVTGIDRDDVIQDVIVQGITDSVVDRADDSAVRAVYASVDLVVLCAPIAGIRSELGRALGSAAVVTDVGSTKREIVTDAAHARHFVGGHPLAGGSEAGAASARGDLFHGRRWVLCPEDADSAAVEQVEALVSLVGAEPARMTAAAHDRAVAITSHLPQLLASALVGLSERHQSGLAEGPGFASTTRIAGGNPQIWRDILVTNADAVAAVLAELITDLETVQRSLERGEADAALSLVEAARRMRGGTTTRSR